MQLDSKEDIMELQDELSKVLKESINDAFMATLSISPQMTEESIMSDEHCIISSIGFAGTIDGSCSICLPYSSAQFIVSKMLQLDIEEMNEDVVDGIAEQINMITGGVKMKLAGSGQDFTISIPTTIKGNRMVILSDFSKTTMISLNYKFEDIVFSISFIYKIHKEKDEEVLAKKKARAEAVERLNQLVDKNGS